MKTGAKAARADAKVVERPGRQAYREGNSGDANSMRCDAIADDLRRIAQAKKRFPAYNPGVSGLRRSAL